MSNVKCFWCDAEVGFDLHRDHVVPKSKGGPDEAWNMVIACKACNSGKRAKWPLDWVKELEWRLDKRRYDELVEFAIMKEREFAEWSAGIKRPERGISSFTVQHAHSELILLLSLYKRLQHRYEFKYGERLLLADFLKYGKRPFADACRLFEMFGCHNRIWCDPYGDESNKYCPGTCIGDFVRETADIIGAQSDDTHMWMGTGETDWFSVSDYVRRSPDRDTLELERITNEISFGPFDHQFVIDRSNALGLLTGKIRINDFNHVAAWFVP